MPISDQTPQVILISDDTNMIGMAVSGSIPANTPGILLAGITNNTTASFLKLDSGGNLFITGSISSTVTGILSASITNFPAVQTITGSIQLVGISTITGSVGITGIPTITGSITVGNLVPTTNVSLVGNGSIIPATGSIIGGSDGTNFRFLSVDSLGRLNIVGNITASNSTIGGTGSLAPFSASLFGGKDPNGNLQSFAVTTAGYQFITGTVQIAGIPTITGSITVPNLVSITGTVGITNLPLTQSVLIQNVTLPVSVSNFPIVQSITGSVQIVGIPTITGSITVSNLVQTTGSTTVNGLTFGSGGLAVFITGSNNIQSITGSTQIVGIPTVTGSVSVLNIVTVTGSLAATFTDPAEGITGSAVPSRAIFVGGSDGTNLRGLSVDSSGRLNIIGTISSSNPSIGATGSNAPISGNLVAGIDGSGILRPLSTTTTGILNITGSTQIVGIPTITGSVGLTGISTVTGSITVPNLVQITGSVGITGIPTITGSVTVSNLVNITGSAQIVGIPTVTGSVTVSNLLTASVAITNIPTITGSITVPNIVFITDRTLGGTGSLAPFTASLIGGRDPSGNLQPFSLTTGGILNVSASITGTVGITGIPTFTGSVTVSNLLTASVSITNIATVTGSITVPNLVSVTGTIASVAEGATGSSVPIKAVFVGGADSGNILRAFSVDFSGKLILANMARTGSASPISGALVGGKDENSNFQPLATDASGALYQLPVNIGIYEGRFAGTVDVIRGNINTSAAAEYALRQTTYTEPTSSQQRSFNSNNAADAAAGTGARTIQLTYYSYSSNTITGPLYETITLNGTSNVNSVATNIGLVEKIEVMTAGSTGNNVGIISMFGSVNGGGGTIATIAVTSRQTNYAHHYVPTGKRCFLRNFTAYSTVSNANAPTFMIRFVSFAAANQAERIIMNTVQVQGSTISAYVEFPTLRAVLGPARVTVYHTTVNGTNQTGFAEAEYFEM